MLLVFLFILGLSIGSFLNVLIDRLPKGQSLWGRSYCDHCKKKLESFDLIPVVSFINLKGKCRFCRKKISFQYPLIELLTGFVFVVGFLFAPGGEIISRILYLGIFSTLIVIFFADLKYQIIPDGALIGFSIFSLLILLIKGQELVFLKGISAGFLTMVPILFLNLVTQDKGMGFGDVKLAFLIGFLLGPIGGVAALYFAFVIGALYGSALIFTKRKTLKSKVAFGPFLVVGTVIVIFWYGKLVEIIEKLYGNINL